MGRANPVSRNSNCTCLVACVTSPSTACDSHLRILSHCTAVWLDVTRRGDERAARALGLVELMRDVYAQEKRLVELRTRIRTEHPGEPPFKVEWVAAE
jgi:hypothetical protein